MAQSAGLTMSTVWTQLALPLSPVGSIPFVGDDGLTIDIDPSNFHYYSGGQPINPPNSSLRSFQLTVEGGLRTCMDDLSGSPAASLYTINKPTGKVIFPAGSISIRVNNTYCPAGSVVLVQLETNDATLKNLTVVVGNNTFVINADAAPTVNCRVAFICFATF